MLTGDELVSAFEQLSEEYARFVEAQTGEAFRRRSAPEEWSTAEMTGHVAEFPVTFAAQAKRVAEQPGSQLGRSLEDPARLAAVQTLVSAGPAEAAAAVRSCARAALATLRSIQPDGWAASGTHPRLGEMTVSHLVEHFMVDHVRDHLKQAQESVGVA